MYKYLSLIPILQSPRLLSRVLDHAPIIIAQAGHTDQYISSSNSNNIKRNLDSNINHSHLIHLRCTCTLFIFTVFVPYSSLLYLYLIHLCCIYILFIFIIFVPYLFLLYLYLIYLCCTHTLFIFAVFVLYLSSLYSYLIYFHCIRTLFIFAIFAPHSFSLHSFSAIDARNRR